MKRSTVLVFCLDCFWGAVAVPVRAVKRRKLCDITNVCCAPLQQMIHNSGVYFHLLHLDIHFFLLLCHFDFEYIFLLLSNLHKLMFYILLIYNWDGFSISLLLSFVLHKGRYNNLRHLYNEIQPVVWNSN